VGGSGGGEGFAAAPPLRQRKPASPAIALFAWLISHQPAVLFSQDKPATSNQPAVLFSQNKPTPAISQPNRLMLSVRWRGRQLAWRSARADVLAM
jgi:hypothetical protein